MTLFLGLHSNTSLSMRYPNLKVEGGDQFVTEALDCWRAQQQEGQLTFRDSSDTGPTPGLGPLHWEGVGSPWFLSGPLSSPTKERTTWGKEILWSGSPFLGKISKRQNYVLNPEHKNICNLSLSRFSPLKTCLYIPFFGIDVPTELQLSSGSRQLLSDYIS